MEEEIHKLRLQLKTARNDVKRYASYALRLQQELEREKQKRKEDEGNGILDEKDARFPELREEYSGPAATSFWDKKVEKARKEHVAWCRKIDGVIQTLNERREDDRGKKKDVRRDNQSTDATRATVVAA
ncbi:uncharacterized protein IUM83_13457 [Phytophthora cinnamomi]|uniref:uncharacterized protein n=1 Tax=Phytophthora cinnamomi TaxID=4785 RepID=UPI003559DEBA|nr:hypothetical protein IUM83_13457 [Phytophthora cinnamomi]